MFQTTRRRLALWYAVVTAVLLLLFASGVYFYVRSTLVERIDDTLNHVVEVVRRSLVIEPINPHSEGGLLQVNIEASFRDNAATGEDDRIDIEWFSPTGELLWSTFFDPLNVPLHVNSNGETVKAVRKEDGEEDTGTRGHGDKEIRGDAEGKTRGQGDGKHSALSPQSSALSTPYSPLPPPSSEPLLLRQITKRIEIGRSVLGYLRVSHPWFEVTKPSREFFVDLILGTVLMVSAVAAIGWFLSGLAMKPVRQSYQRLKQFTADASHELRSPIAVIQTNVQVALADPDLDPHSQQHLKVVERLTRRLGRLVDDLLFLARQDGGMSQPHLGEVALSTLLKEVIEEQQTLAHEKQIQIDCNLAETSDNGAVLHADRDQLARLFTNLVGNAVQYTPPKGNVFVQLQPVGRSGGSALQVAIRDTGIGIAADVLPHVFDRFYRADPSRSQASSKGSGLGLAIAQAIVQNHQGQIQIESQLGHGTTVTVALPQKDEG